MTVYVVVESDYNHSEIRGVFTSEETAQSFVETEMPDIHIRKYCWSIEKHEVQS